MHLVDLRKRRLIQVSLLMGCLIFLVGCGKSKRSTVQEGESLKRKVGIQTIKKEGQAAPKKVVMTDSKEKQIEDYMKQMTIEEEIGQLFIVAFRKDAKGQNVTKLIPEVKEQIEKYHIGGVILFSENIVDTIQTKKLISDLQASSKVPLFIGVDEEGGIVSRVGKKKSMNAVPFKEAYSLGQTGNTQYAYEEAKRMGKLLKGLGFNMDFAPVADIYNEPSNKVIGKRSFGKDSKTVTPMVLAFSKGLQEEGIQPVVKHFPGHGNTVEDSHKGIAYVKKDLVALEKEELVPFKAAIEGNVGAVMKGHLLVPAVDDHMIVSLSSKWQKYMASHYDLNHTLVMTDAMEMGAVVNNYDDETAAYLSMMAGNDVILMPKELKVAYEDIYKEYKEGRISKARIDDSVRKILSKKVAQNLLALS